VFCLSPFCLSLFCLSPFCFSPFGLSQVDLFCLIPFGLSQRPWVTDERKQTLRLAFGCDCVAARHCPWQERVGAWNRRPGFVGELSFFMTDIL
jgi:hypothetical protein